MSSRLRAGRQMEQTVGAVAVRGGLEVLPAVAAHRDHDLQLAVLQRYEEAPDICLDRVDRALLAHPPREAFGCPSPHLRDALMRVRTVPPNHAQYLTALGHDVLHSG